MLYETKRQQIAASVLPEIAFFYPGIWQNDDWIKNALLFFDGIAILVPDPKRMPRKFKKPKIADALEELGLLHYIIADEQIDKGITFELSECIENLLSSGVWNDLETRDPNFVSLSISRLGRYGDFKEYNRIFQALSSRGLVVKAESDRGTIRLHPLVRGFVLAVLAHALRKKGPALGLELCPITEYRAHFTALEEVLNAPEQESAGSVVEIDKEIVAPDLSRASLQDILEYRRDHFDDHRKYMRLVRQFAREISYLPHKERERARFDRQTEILDLANDLSRKGRLAWRARSSFMLGIAAGFWTYHTGDPIGALLATGSVLSGATGKPKPEAGAYTYLFRTRIDFR
jgi:hypothetical protein